MSVKVSVLVAATLAFSSATYGKGLQICNDTEGKVAFLMVRTYGLLGFNKPDGWMATSWSILDAGKCEDVDFGIMGAHQNGYLSLMRYRAGEWGASDYRRKGLRRNIYHTPVIAWACVPRDLTSDYNYTEDPMQDTQPTCSAKDSPVKFNLFFHRDSHLKGFSITVTDNPDARYALQYSLSAIDGYPEFDKYSPIGADLPNLAAPPPLPSVQPH